MILSVFPRTERDLQQSRSKSRALTTPQTLTTSLSQTSSSQVRFHNFLLKLAFGQNLGIIFLRRYFYMMCSAPKQRFKITPCFFSVCYQPVQRSQTSNQRTGCSSTTRTNALRVWLSEAPSPHTWRQGRPDTLQQGRRCVAEDENRHLRTQGLGPGAPLVLKAAPTASQYKFNPHHKLFRSAQPPQEPPQAQKLRSVTALPRVVYIVSMCCL